MEGEALRTGVEGGGGCCWPALPKLGINKFGGVAFGSSLPPLTWLGGGDLMSLLCDVFFGDAGKNRLRREGLEEGAASVTCSELPMRAKASE